PPRKFRCLFVRRAIWCLSSVAENFAELDGTVRSRSGPNGFSLLVEAVQAGRIRRQPHAVAGFQIKFADVATREHSDFSGFDIKEGIAAEVFVDRPYHGPIFALFADLKVLEL